MDDKRQFPGMVVIVLILPIFLTWALTLFLGAAQEQTLSDSVKHLDAELKPMLVATKVPAVAGTVILDGKIRAAGAVGVRKLGDPTSVTVFAPLSVGDQSHAHQVRDHGVGGGEMSVHGD